MLLFRAFVPLAISGLVAGIIGLVFSVLHGLAAFALLLVLQHALYVWRFARLDRWTRSPSVDITLEADGNWDAVFSRLYHHEKDLRQQIDDREHNNRMLRSAIQALTDGVVLLDLNNYIVFCNEIAEMLLGLQMDKDRGSPLLNLVRQPEFSNYLEQGDFSRPLTFRPERYKDRIYTAHVIPYAGSRRLLQIKDVTQAEKVDQTRRDFVANVSHELRTPLTVISGFLETLQEINLNADEQRRALALMLTQSQRMKDIVQDLLTLSSLESSPLPDNSVIDMAVLIQGLKRDAELLSNGYHTILFHTDPCTWKYNLLGSERELSSAFGNFLSNAVRYTPAGGTITLAWRASDQGAEFSVCDTGLGIAPEHVSRLTERFYRVDKGRSHEVGGTGLGLAIAKHAINRHQGDIYIKSELGKGSCFTAHFPVSRIVPAME